MKNYKEEKRNILTSKERKEQRRQEELKASGKKPASPSSSDNQEVLQTNPVIEPDEPSGVVGAVETGFGQTTFNRNKLWIIITAGVMALIMVLFAILIPTVIAPSMRFRDTHHAVVVFTLNTRDPVTNRRDRIEIIVYQDVVQHTSINFIHLARMGFFNDTIIFDTTGNFVRFGQFEDNTFTNFRTRNEEFIRRSVRNMPRPSYDRDETQMTQGNFTGDSPFDYRITGDTGEAGHLSTGAGVISLMHTFSGTDFKISAGNLDGGPPIADIRDNRPPHTATLNMPGRPFGHITIDTMPVVIRLAQMNTMQNSPHRFFTPPQTENGESVRIVSTNVYNIDFWGKWRTFNWNEYFSRPENAGSINMVGGSGWHAPNDPNFTR